jgi:predicted flap endonuclease-1-like 5' DNA nuclease
MFTNITRSYDMKDATIEILIMLAGAFLLGFLLNYALNNRRKQISPYSSQPLPNKKPATSSKLSERRNYDKIVAAALSDSDHSAETDMGNTKGNKGVGIDDTNSVETLADDRSINLLSKLTDSRRKKSPPLPTQKAKSNILPIKHDDFQRIMTISPEAEELLHKAGIHTYLQLQLTSLKKIIKILADCNDPYSRSDPKTWSYQAKLAELGKWKTLKKYQQTLPFEY